MIDALVEELRRAFDDCFAQPARGARTAGQRLLLVQAGGQHLALPIGSLRGVERGRTVVTLPGASPSLRGIAGVRGQVVPVYALAELVGASGGAGEWLAIAAGDAPVALAFDALSGLVDVAPDAIEPAGPAAPPHATATCRALGEVYWIVHVPVLLEQIAGRCARPRETSS